MLEVICTLHHSLHDNRIKDAASTRLFACSNSTLIPQCFVKQYLSPAGIYSSSAGALQRDSEPASRESASDNQSIPDQPGSSRMGSSAREQARQSRKRPLADPDGSDAEDASVPEPTVPTPAAAPSRKSRVPSRPSGAGSSARPPGKPASPEVRSLQATFSHTLPFSMCTKICKSRLCSRHQAVHMLCHVGLP